MTTIKGKKFLIEKLVLPVTGKQPTQTEMDVHTTTNNNKAKKTDTNHYKSPNFG